MSVPASDAATIIVARDGDSGLEVFMLRRSPRSDFVPGAYVFPGGAVEDADRAGEMVERCRGLTDSEASRRLGVGSGGLALWVAAVRECFEEAGLLLALASDGEYVVLDDAFSVHRAQLNAGTKGFADLCRAAGLTLPVDRIHYFSHWITPDGAPIRYDTRFFVCAAPPGQVPLHDGRETVDHCWIAPRQALEDHAAGRFHLVPATKSQLESMLPFGTAAGLVANAADLDDIPTIQAVIIPGENGEPGRIRIPFPDGPVEIPMPSA